MIYGLFYSYSCILVQQGAGIDYVFSLPGKTVNAILENPADYLGLLMITISTYWLLVVEILVVFSILALRPAVLRRYPRIKPLFIGFMAGIVAVGLYQGLLNFYNVQSIGLPVPPVNGMPGSVALLAICDAAGLVLSYRPLKKMKKIDIRPYQIALVIVFLALLVSIVMVSVTVITNVEMSGVLSPATVNTRMPSGPSATITPTGKPTAGPGPGSVQTPVTGSYGVDPLMLVSIAGVAVVAIALTTSYFMMEELSILFLLVKQLLRPLWSGGSKRAVAFDGAGHRSTARQSRAISGPPGYVEDLGRLMALYKKYGYEHEDYIAMVNQLSDKYGMDTSRIVYDQWSTQKT